MYFFKGFEGQKCEVNTDECADKPCHNHGYCVDGIANFTCK